MRLPPLKAGSGELLHLDLMRFIASVGIVFHHSNEFFVAPERRPAVVGQTMGLALFVDLFFVISGFVIAYVYHDRVASTAGYFDFMRRRVGRLVPLHWLTLGISILIWSAFALLHYAGNHMPSFRPACIAETALLMHAWLPCGNNLQFNGVSWSISAEMVMYAVFPLWAMLGGVRPRALLAAGVFFLAAALGIACLRQGQPLGGVLWTEVTPVLRALPSFVLGAALYYNRRLFSLLPAPGWVLTLATAALIAAMLSGVTQMLVLPLIYLAAAAAVAADLRGQTSATVKRLAPLGQLTYSIYMWHGLFILIFMNALGDKFLHAGPAVMAALAVLCYGARWPAICRFS